MSLFHRIGVSRIVFALSSICVGMLLSVGTSWAQATSTATVAGQVTDQLNAVIPGVEELLDGLSSREGITLALLTGNYEPVARLKLRRAGLGRYFPSGQGAFGSDAEDRAALPAIARRRADGRSTRRRS